MELFLFWFILSILCGMYANKLNRSGFGYFIISLVLSPLIGFAILLVIGEAQKVKNLSNWQEFSPDSKQDKKIDSGIDELVKLSELYEKGHLNKEEFETQKAKLLNA